jgi:hypothetical protein
MKTLKAALFALLFVTLAWTLLFIPQKKAARFIRFFG